jgi:hypothetical protein
MSEKPSNEQTRFLKGLAEIGVALLVLLSVANTSRCQEIHIQILDGQTGRPVANQCVEMWVGGNYKQSLLAPADNKEGTANFRLGGGSIRAVWPPDTKCHDDSPKELTIPAGLEKIAVNPFVAVSYCWDLGPLRLPPWYEISEILQHGAVSQNRCGQATAEAKAGELILFVKPWSFWRRLDGLFFG